MLTPDHINAIAKQRGDTVVNPPPADGINRAQELQNAWNTPAVTPKEPGFLSKAASYIFGGPTISNAIPGVSELGAGIAKSGLSTLQGASTIGQNIGQAIGLMPKQPIVELPKSLTEAQGTLETIGKTAGDIAQFFIPGGAEKVAAGKLGEVLDTAKLAEKYGPEAAKTIKGLWDALSTGLATGASTQAVSELQTGGKAGAGYGVAGFLGGAGGKLLESVAPSVAKALAKADLRLSPTQEAKFGSKVDDAASFLSENRIKGTTNMQYKKVDKLTSQMEDAVKASVPKDVTVSRADLEVGLKAIPDTFKDKPAIYNKVKSDVETAINTLKTTQPKDIPLDSLMNQKRSYAGAAYAKDGSKMISTSKFGISNVFYDALDNAMKENNIPIKIPEKLQQYFGGATEMTLKDFNKTYSKAVSASQLLDISKEKADVGLFSRILVTAIARKLGMPFGTAGEAGAAALGYEGAARGVTPLRSLLGAGIQKAETTIPSAVKVGAGIVTPSSGGDAQELGQPTGQ